MKGQVVNSRKEIVISRVLDITISFLLEFIITNALYVIIYIEVIYISIGVYKPGAG